MREPYVPESLRREVARLCPGDTITGLAEHIDVMINARFSGECTAGEVAEVLFEFIDLDRRTDAAPAHPPLALRWEGNDCHVGKMCLGRVYDRGDNWTFDRWLPRVVRSPGRSDIIDPHPTREAARAAVEAAIRERLGIVAPDTRVIDVETKR